MRRITAWPLLACTLLFLARDAGAQTAQPPVLARGKIMDEKGSPLHGATVEEKDRPTNSVLTDSSGDFSLTLRGRSKQIVISYVGFDDLTAKVAAEPLSIHLKASKSNMNDVVVIGYQGMKRRNLTAAVSSISGKDIQDIPEASFDQMLQGRLPGVSVLASSGEPGSKLAVVIRGATNVDYGNANGGNTGPLYVIDGVIYDVNSITPAYTSYNMITNAQTQTNPLSLINPNDIESIDVLKDASASAIYGARAGNGVIIVKTKKAKRGKPQVTASGYVGATAHPTFRHVLTGSAERNLKLALLNSQMDYTSIQGNYIPLALTDSLNPAFNNDVDWQGLIVRDKAMVNNQDVAVAGYLGSSSYRLSVNHYNEQGVLNGYGLDRIAPHLSLHLNPLRGLSVNTDLLVSSEKRMHGAGGANGELFSSWSFPTSFVQLNPTQIALYKGDLNLFDDNHVLSFQGSIGVADTITHELLFNSTYSANNYLDRWDYYIPSTVNGTLNTAYDINSSNPSWTWENYLTWMKAFGDHHLTVVGGIAAYETRNYYTNASAAGISVTGISTLETVPAGANLNVYSTVAEKTTASYYGRVTYDYKGKYLLTGAFRRDASSIYSAAYRWGTFPSASLGWIVSDENFMERAKKVVNFFKLRASFGITGMDPGSWYSKYQSLSADASFYGSTTGTLSGGTYTALAGTPSTYNGTTVISPFPYQNWVYDAGVAASTSVRWEKYPQIDLGTDIELFNSRINLAVDVYQKDAIGKYFYNIPAQTTTGYQFYSGNFLNIRNQGLEIGINTHNLGRQSKLQWTTSLNLAFNKNFVTKTPNGGQDFLFGPPWFQQTLSVGKPLFNYRVWQANGAYGTDADVPTDPITGKKMTFFGSTLHAGDPAYVDQNGDYNIDYTDKVNYGNPNPKVTGGFGNTFTYKGFSLNVFCSFVLGRKIFNGYVTDALNGSSGSNAGYTSWGAVSGPASISEIMGEFWTKPGDKTKFPRLVYPPGAGLDPWDVATSYFVESGDFFKVKQVTLGYNLPEKWSKALHVRFTNVYGMAENVFMWKKSKLIPDPELADPTTGTLNVVYPSAIKITVGLRTEL